MNTVRRLFYVDLLSNSKSWNLIVFLLCSIWLPLPFINFDSHHDGLILSTIRLTGDSISNGGEYPFNQYGPFWAMPFVFFSKIVPSDLLFISIRILTVMFYLTSAFILLKIGRIFLSKYLARVAVLLFLGSQPFVSGLGSDLVPWPSAVVMPLVLGVAYFLLSYFSGGSQLRYSKYKLIGAGCLLPLIVFTRLQVGLLLLILIYFIFLFYKQLWPTIFVTTGILVSSFFVLGSLAFLGWLRPALYDQFVFGATYLAADKSTFPKPFITFAIASVFLLLIANINRVFSLFLKYTQFFLVISSSLICVLVLGSGLFLYRFREVSYLQVLDLLTRRFWISILLAAVLLAALTLISWFFQTIRKSNKFRGVDTYNLLLGMAIAFQFQMYPLFDQMHSWWGSPLTYLILVTEIQKRLGHLELDYLKLNLIRHSSLLLLALTLILPWGQQILGAKKEMPVEIGRFLYTNSSGAEKESSLQEFFRRELPTSSRILNLCDNSNVFFADGRYVPASRFFIYWAEQMSHAPDILASMKNSSPDYIVTCGLTHAPDLRERQEALQLQLIKEILANQVPIAVHKERADKIWRIYKKA